MGGGGVWEGVVYGRGCCPRKSSSSDVTLVFQNTVQGSQGSLTRHRTHQL